MAEASFYLSALIAGEQFESLGELVSSYKQIRNGKMEKEERKYILIEQQVENGNDFGTDLSESRKRWKDVHICTAVSSLHEKLYIYIYIYK